MKNHIKLDQSQYCKINKKLDTGFFERVRKAKYSSTGIMHIKVNNNGSYILPFSSTSHRLDNSCFDAYTLEPLATYKGEVKHKLDNDLTRMDILVGLVVTCKEKAFVVTGLCKIFLDISSLNFIESITDVKRLISKQTGYWVSKSELLGVYHDSGFTYCHLVDRSKFRDENYYVTYVIESGNPALKFIGDSKDFVLKVVNSLRTRIANMEPKNVLYEQISLF
tara:strand:+ start:10935 stop:11600 length:666 start_codon:yes stop_codon:yes gene_type:complete